MSMALAKLEGIELEAFMNNLIKAGLLILATALMGCSQTEYSFAPKNPIQAIDSGNNGDLGTPNAAPGTAPKDSIGPQTGSHPIETPEHPGAAPSPKPPVTLPPVSEPPVSVKPPPVTLPPVSDPPVVVVPPPAPPVVVKPPPVTLPPVSDPPVVVVPPPTPAPPVVVKPPPTPIPPVINPCDPSKDETLISKEDMDHVKKISTSKDFDEKHEVHDKTEYSKRGRSENKSEDLIGHMLNQKNQKHGDDDSGFKLCVVDSDDKKIIRNDDDDRDDDHGKHVKKHHGDDDEKIRIICVGNSVDARADELENHGFKGLNGKHKNKFMCCTNVVLPIKGREHYDDDKDRPIAKGDKDHEDDNDDDGENHNGNHDENCEGSHDHQRKS